MSGPIDAKPAAPGRPGARGEARAEWLLERPLPEGYREEWARHFAVADMQARVDEGTLATVVIFRIGDEWLALGTDLFHEVAEPRRIHSLPHRRDDLVLGIVNVRGELVVCVSLAKLLGIGEQRGPGAGERIKTFARLVVVGRDGRRLAFSVDEVHGIHRYAPRDVLAVPATIGRSAATFARAVIRWQGRSVGRLDDAAVLDALDRSIA